MELEKENATDGVHVVTRTTVTKDSNNKIDNRGPNKMTKLIGMFTRKKTKTSDNVPVTPQKGWVQPDGVGGTDGHKGVTDAGIGVVLLIPNSGDAEAELIRQDINEIQRMDDDQDEARNNMLLKMLKMKLRKMKNKGNISDPYMADFTQKIIDTKRNNQEVLDIERQEGEQELRKKHGKNKTALDNDLEALNAKLDVKKRQLESDELDTIRGELLRTSGLNEAEVDDLINKLKGELSEFQRRQGIQQARQAQHLAERLERRRQILEFRKLQEQQLNDKIVSDVSSYEEPIDKLIEDGKLTEKQKKELLDQYEKNLMELKKKQDTERMRQQADLAEKLRQRRLETLRKLAEKQEKEQIIVLAKADKSTNSEEFMNTFHTVCVQQQTEQEQLEQDLDQAEIQEMEKLSKTIETQTDEAIQELSGKLVQTITQTGQLADIDARRIIKLHNLRMEAHEARRKEERERMMAKLQEKWQQKMLRLEDTRKRDEAARVAVLEQQDNIVKQVLNSNLELSDDAKEKILQEHERNMVALNSQMARSKVKQQMSLEQKLSQRRARLAELKSQQENMKLQKRQMSEKEIQRLQDELDREIALYEQEKKEAEASLRRQLALESEAALAQQERHLATLIGRLEVGHARRQAVLNKQDQTLKQLQDKVTLQLETKVQLEQKLDNETSVSTNWADQIIQQHYNQVENVNDMIQRNREKQERMIQEKIQAKKLMLQREVDEQLVREQQEQMMTRRQAGAGFASNILNQALMEQRTKRAREEVERDMQIELERQREKLNSDLQKSLEDELEAHRGEFLTQLAAASNLSPGDMQKIAQAAVRDTGDPRLAKRLSKTLQQDVERAKSSLGIIEDDSDEDNPRYQQESKDDLYGRRQATASPKKKKKKHYIPPPKPAFTTSTGENVHGMWDDDDLL